MWTTAFFLAVLERAVKTFAQTAAALLTASGIGLLEVDWVQIASVSGMAALVSVLTSIGTGAITDGSPSVGSVETVAEWPVYRPERVDYGTPDGSEPTGTELGGVEPPDSEPTPPQQERA